MILTEQMRSAIRNAPDDWDPLSAATGSRSYSGTYDMLFSQICVAIEDGLDGEQLAHNFHEKVEQMGVILGPNAASDFAVKIHRILCERIGP